MQPSNLLMKDVQGLPDPGREGLCKLKVFRVASLAIGISSWSEADSGYRERILVQTAVWGTYIHIYIYTRTYAYIYICTDCERVLAYPAITAFV